MTTTEESPVLCGNLVYGLGLRIGRRPEKAWCVNLVSGEREAMSGYNTNLASEFYALSILHRLGIDATLTLGNKKSKNRSISQSFEMRDAGDTLTVDVKGLAGATGWPVDNFHEKAKHFLVLVCFLNKIDDLSLLKTPNARKNARVCRWAS